jgi:predicted nucleic acid-binding protein
MSGTRFDRQNHAQAQVAWHLGSPAIASLAAQLRAQYKLRLPNALQLATALEVGADALVTHDRDFSKVTGLRVLTGAD